MSRRARNTILLLLCMVMLLLYGAYHTLQDIFLKEETVYTCTVCFKDKPTQCAVEDQRHGEARGEQDARESAKIGLCGQLDMDLKAEIACKYRPPEDFKVTCTSSIVKRWAIMPGGWNAH